MPLYDYRCKECDELWEEDLPMKYRGFVTCPTCRSGHTQRIILTAPAMTLNWWNAAASDDTDGISQRFRPRVDNKITTRQVKRRRKENKEMAHEH